MPEAARRLPRARGAAALTLYGLLILVLLICFSPLLAVAVRSVSGAAGPTLAFWRGVLAPDNDPPLGLLLGNTLRFAGLTLCGAVLLGASHALGAYLSRSRPLDALSLLPLMLSPVSVGVGYLLSYPGWAAQLGLLIAAYTLIASPLITRSLLPALRALPLRALEAARTLGASPLTAARTVALPLVWPALRGGAALSLATVLGEFGATLVLTRPEWATLSTGLYERLSRPGAQNLGEACALATLLLGLAWGPSPCWTAARARWPERRDALHWRAMNRLGIFCWLALCGAAQADSVPVFVTLPTPDLPPSHLGALPTSCRCPAAARPAPYPRRAGPLPPAVTGRVGFYAGLYDAQFRPLKALGLGQVNALFPLGSAFKPQVVRAALQEVDAGRLSLRALITTTPGKRSIEGYPPGQNTVAQLAQWALERSDNTASDLLQLGLGPPKIARAVQALSPCTSLLHTTKAWWAAQAGLMPDVFPNLVTDAVNASNLPFETRLTLAERLNARAQDFTGPQVEAALDTYFHGPAYAPQLELALQNTSTPQSYADLLARTLGGDDLKPATRALFRRWLAASCCQPRRPALRALYWGHKAGSGWRLLTLTGYAELPGGRRLAYAYFNDGSNTLESEDMERQIPAVVAWIDAALIELAR